ncbi:MAG TPA: ABC transporter permease [Candidatus Dormibacteraeota bacterium]|nr:ABC transporter permease [Candidatus Dormibacteraeota bacterium]
MGNQIALGSGQAIAVAEQPLQGWRDARRRLTQAIVRSRKAMLGLLLIAFVVVLSLFPGLIAPGDPHAAIYDPNLGSVAGHPFGTTQIGEDVFTQLVYGTRLTLIITVVVGLLTTILSVIVGLTAAYLGGAADRVLSLLTDVFLIIPTLPLLIVLSAYLSGSGTIAIIGVLTVTGWAFGARQLRAQGLSMRTRDFLEAARARGEGSTYIILMEILPNMLSLVVATFLSSAVYTVATAAGLQFLGLGNSNDITWGTMLHYAQQNGALWSGNALWALAPGGAVALLGAAFALLNYAFDELTNPALRPVRRRLLASTTGGSRLDGARPDPAHG